MWEIYTLYMINEAEKIAVSFYTHRSPVHLKTYGEELLILLDFDRYIIIGMDQNQTEKKLKGYKIVKEHDYDYTKPTIRSMRLNL